MGYDHYIEVRTFSFCMIYDDVVECDYDKSTEDTQMSHQ
jgi:hypothetical protein